MSDEILTMSAGSLGAQIAAGERSSAETLNYFMERQATLDGPVNAVINTNPDAARQRATEADEAAARGESWGPLHGVPMTLKDTWEFIGMTATAGASPFKDHQPASNADAVQRLLDAGAVVWGKTNTPLFAGDVQTYNDLFGTTSNPWDISRTPGGSSGGAAAALAAGFTPLELGSDIGGSIRTPAHYCGVYGHKPTLEIVPLRGHIPGPPGTLGGSTLAVAGPLASTASDLRLALDLIAGPPTTEPAGWDLNLPEPRFTSLSGLRVGLWFEDPVAPIMSGMADAFRALGTRLSDAGAQVSEVTLAGRTLEDFVVPYLQLLSPEVSMGMPPAVLEAMAGRAETVHKQVADGQVVSPFMATQYEATNMTHMDWNSLNERRLKMRQQIVEFFDDYDVLLTPVTPVAAPLHNNERAFGERVILVDGRERPYLDQLFWIGPATMCGLPSTSAPIGLVDGLPVNTQIIGKPYADRSTIAVAQLMEEAFGPAARPAGF